MMYETLTIPQPQRLPERATLRDSGPYENYLRSTFEQVHLQFDTVQTVIDLFCGNGTYSLGSILLFPNAEIRAVDYHGVLVPDAENHQRVKFHQGWVTDVLADKSIPRADIVLMINASDLHGFNKNNISLLSSHVGQYLFAGLDNGNIENEPWFRDRFDYIVRSWDLNSHIWKPK